MPDIQTLRQFAVAAPGNSASLTQLLNHLIDGQTFLAEQVRRVDGRVQIALEAIGAAGEQIANMSAEVQEAVRELRAWHPNEVVSVKGRDDHAFAPESASEAAGHDRQTNEGGPPPSEEPPAAAQEKQHDDARSDRGAALQS